MRPIKKLAARAAAATTTLGLAVTGMTLIGGVPAAQAKLTETDYGLQATSYGTRAYSNMVGLSSDKTAWSFITCTTLAGIEKRQKIAEVNLPADDPMIRVGAVVSNTRTFKNKKQGIVAGSEGTNRVARVSVGGGDTPVLTIEGLRSTSRAWADKAGKLHAENDVRAADLKLLNLPEEIPAELRDPLQDLLDAVNSGVKDVLGQVLDALAENDNSIVIPGLGEIGVTFDRVTKSKFHAAAEGAVLKIRLYGPDTVKGGTDDSVVNVGHSWARINKDLPVGVFSGKGYGASVELLDGVVSVGELGLQPLPCRGTDGNVKDNSVAGLDLGNAGMLELSAVSGRTMGKPKKNGSAVAWTEGGLADLSLGGDAGLQIKGVVGRAKVKMNRFGKIKTRNIKGSSIGELIVGGESMGAIGPGEMSQLPTDQLPPGVLEVRFFDQQKMGKRGIKVSAVVIKLAEGSPLGSEIRLGNAQVRIQRY